jgi:hypothetical protein
VKRQEKKRRSPDSSTCWPLSAFLREERRREYRKRREREEHAENAAFFIYWLTVTPLASPAGGATRGEAVAGLCAENTVCRLWLCGEDESMYLTKAVAPGAGGMEKQAAGCCTERKLTKAGSVRQLSAPQWLGLWPKTNVAGPHPTTYPTYLMASPGCNLYYRSCACCVTLSTPRPPGSLPRRESLYLHVCLLI